MTLKLKYPRLLPVLLLTFAMSCTKQETITKQESLRPIVFNPSVDFRSGGESGTKAITSPTETDTLLLSDYSIYSSAFYTDPEFPATSGDFFTGIRFDYDETSGGWIPAAPAAPAAPDASTPAPEIFWPLAGEGNGLDFLAVATDIDSLDIASTLLWAGQDDSFLHGERNVHGVKMTMPESYCSTEILYAIASQKCNDKSPVKMTFKHTQCCLEFHIRLQANLDSLLRLNRIVVEDAYSTGECRIETHPIVKLIWNFGGSELHSKEVPHVKESTPVTKSKPLTYSMVLPPQQVRDISFHFQQRSSDTDPDKWEELSVHPVYRATPLQTTWEAGKKYIFEVIIKFGEIVIEPTVAEWTDGEDIVIPV